MTFEHSTHKIRIFIIYQTLSILRMPSSSVILYLTASLNFHFLYITLLHVRKQKPKKSTVSYYKKPSDLSIKDWQRELRKQFIAEKTPNFLINQLEVEHPVFADYAVKNPDTDGLYKVALRSRNPGPNFCTCMDFKTNLLGTCKHIEAVLYHIRKDRKLAKLLADEYRPPYSSIFLKYGSQHEVMLRIGTNHEEQFRKLAIEYFDKSDHLLPDAYDSIDDFLAKAAKISPDFRCYQDAVDFIIAVREKRKRNIVINKKFAYGKNGYFDTLLKATLYPYQKEGILFAARAGRCLLADEMGLGKTIQAIGAAELFRKEFGIRGVLIVCPTSLKYQWKNEIEKFTDSSVSVIEGDVRHRQKQYDEEGFYKIVSYNVVGADLAAINKLEPDLVILDEAQRIKNWKTQTARQVKKIESTYAIVLTGTPIENRLEELYSIVQFIDPFRLGPLYQFLEAHQILDDHGKVVGYKDLNHIHRILSDIVLRRTKKEVLSQLPSRTDKHLFVPLTREQADIHEDFADAVARLVNKWKRLGFLDEKDRQRLLSALNCMRMVSDSTYILDQQTRFDTKITELMSILDTVFATDSEKVVIFSQWERMTRLVRAELENRKIRYSYLHGGVPSHKRKPLLDDFHGQSDCRVFLSTDAGGVGLNLQAASLLINLDIPWNPAVLEQRIGRIHRHGQKRNINVINLVSRQSIEERMLEVLKFKSSLFAGVLDNGEDQIFMGEDKFKRFMNSVEKIATVNPNTQIPFTDAEENNIHDEQATEEESPTSELSPATEFFTAAGTFFDTLSKTFADKQKTAQLMSTLIEKDDATGKQYLKIPVENEEVVGKAVEALTGFLSLLKKS